MLQVRYKKGLKKLSFNFIHDVKIMIDGVEYNNFNYSINFSIVRKSNGRSSNYALVNINYLTELTKSALRKKVIIPETVNDDTTSYDDSDEDYIDCMSLDTEIEEIQDDSTNQEDEKQLNTEGHKIMIMAGYKTSGKGLIFFGDIERVEENSSGGIEIRATEGEKNWSTEIVNKNYSAGSTTKQIVKNIMESSSYGMGVIECDDFTYTRGFNAQGTLKSELEKLALQVNAEARINKNLIYFVKKGHTELETTVSANTGLKEIRKTDNGYILTMYLNNMLQENMILNIINHKNENIKTRIDTVSHYYSKLKFETTVECSPYVQQSNNNQVENNEKEEELID